MDENASKPGAPVTDADWPAEIADMREGFAGALNIYRVMAHHPRLLAAWQGLRNHVVLANALSPREQEIVILRAGYRWGSAYEWAHHFVRGRRAGLTSAEIDAAGAERPVLADERLLALIAAVDGLVSDGRIEDPLLSALIGDIGIEAVIDVMATVGMYTTLAFLANSFDPPIDADVAAELAAGD